MRALKSIVCVFDAGHCVGEVWLRSEVRIVEEVSQMFVLFAMFAYDIIMFI